MVNIKLQNNSTPIENVSPMRPCIRNSNPAKSAKYDIAFSHTSLTHVATFTQLITTAAPTLRTLHIVREDFLVDALQPCTGVNDAGLRARVRRCIREAAYAGTDVVVCTCSTISELVETIQLKVRKEPVLIMRIDRAMADAAVKIGAPFLIVAALKSTLQPTTTLLLSSAATAGVSTQVSSLFVPSAWHLFLAGNHAAYLKCVVNAVVAANAKSHTVVLAQASMAGAAKMLEKYNITALSSPELG